MNTVFNVGDVVFGICSGIFYRIVEIYPLASLTTGGYYKAVCDESGETNTIPFGLEDNFTCIERGPVCSEVSNGCEMCGTEMSDHYSYGLGETIKKCQKCGWMK